MKRKFSLILSLVMLLSLFTIGYSETAVEETERLQFVGDFSSDFDLVLEEITKLGDNADLVASINTVVWQAAGPSDAMSALATLLDIAMKGTTEGTHYWMYDDEFYEAFGSYRESVIKSYAKKYYDAYTAVSENVDLVKGYVKELKDTYPDKGSAIDALKAYYIKASAYADFAINPSGTLLSYHSNHETFKKEMNELKIDAEFEE